MWPTLFSLWRTLSGTAPWRPAARRPSARRSPLRLRLEPLEDRLTPSGGLLDPTFGSGGVVTSSFASTEGLYDVTVRAEMSRLRKSLGGLLLARPYRVAPGVDAVLPALTGSALLARSSAPGLRRLAG